ncbi:hypothetical protein DSCA_33320 [Desulfosarcina alkanivorans]|uniref:Cadherin domain-containing protein n=1 Tax=Desulfosarcina alkanivorans TaxID=571177 RepID=A0A5K7YIB0_9BACT|nr:cadherin-like domain-containing protein [Desulfosarcina alkanivorans]BBO69402.1 hypothetical protein DSCA_33320 [Desulfosarcina alkanivorans]
MRKKGEPIKREPNHKGIGIHFEPLEPRILLSGSWGTGMDSPAPDIQAGPRSDFAQDTVAIYERTGRSVAVFEHQNQGPPGSGSTVDLLAGSPALETIPADHAGCSAAPGRIENDEIPSPYPQPDRETQLELVVVDAGIRNHGPLVDDILATAGDDRALEVLVLDSGRDGVEQVSDALAGRQGIDALHILSHGSEGQIQLGSTALTAGSLDAHADAIAGWSTALDGSADILIYGCDVAATPDGRAFIDTLAAMTGADVAASVDPTGNRANGGDWHLEYRVGTLENSVAVTPWLQQNWDQVLGQITVTTTSDTLDGDADTSSLAALAATPGSDGAISLREAIEAANADTGADTIILGSGTYGITRTGLADNTGDFDIRDDLSIVGVSPSQSIVDGNESNRVFEVHDDAAITVSFSNLKIQDGYTGLGGPDGAGLFINGSANTPSVSIANAWFSGNDTGAFGGDGGAIYNQADLTIVNTLIEGNTADLGGGLYNAVGATLRMANVTVSGNDSTDAEGGGLYNGGVATLRNVTVALNTSFTQGGGLFQAGGMLDMANSIFAGNSAGGSGNDIHGVVSSSGYNIVEDIADVTGLIGTDQNVDPLLGGLADNGGDLMTHAPAAAEAIDTADRSLMAITDQRGFLRGDGSPDIGAFEVGASAAGTADYLDRFDTDGSFAGDDGALPWINGWQEVNEADGASNGLAQVHDQFSGDGGGNVELRIKNDSGVWREVDLGGAVSASLSFDYVRADLEVDDHLVVYVQTAGGTGGVPVGDAPGTWDEIGRYSGVADDSTYQSESLDVSSYISTETRILLYAEGVAQVNDYIYIDNVKITLSLTATNAEESLAVNTGITVDEGSADNTVTAAMLLTTDADNTAAELVYTLTAAPTHGTLFLSGAALAATDTFTQDDIDNARITYDHDDSENLSDEFDFSVDDGAGTATTGTFSISVTAVNDNEEILAVNTGITVDEGSADNTVTAAMLATTDADNTAAELVYTLTTAPTHGTLYLSGVALADSDTFTQDDIDNDLITYDHDDSETLSDSFAFSVDDGVGAATTGTFSITVTGVNDAPTLTASADDPIFTEGGAASGLFSGTSASTVEVGQTLSTLVLTVTDAVDGGNEILNIDGNQIALADGTTGTTAINGLLFNVSVIGVTATVTLSGGTLSAAELETLVDGISYQHNSGTPTIGGRTVTLTRLVDSGGTANGGDDTATLAIASTVTVEAAGGTAPVPGNNAISINQGGGIVLDSTMLSATDADNADAGLTFNVSGVSNGWFAFLSDTATPITSFDQSAVTAGNVVFIHDGGELAPAYQISVTDGSTSTAAAPAMVTFSQTGSGVLWVSTDGDVGASNGAPGLDGTGWRKGDILQQAAPNLSLGEAATDGTFSIAFDSSNFATDANVNGMHFVTGTVTIGSSNAITLQAGDLLLTTSNYKTFSSNGAFPPSDLTVDKTDIFFFRPDTPGDYSVGNFYLLLSDPFRDGAEIRGLSLVEKDVWVGDVQLQAGDLLLARSGGAEDNDIWLLETGTLDPTVGGSYPTAQRLIEGDDAGVDIEDKIHGLDIVETDISGGGYNFDAGTILVTLDADDGDGIGTTAQAADQQDIVALQVNKTTLGSGAGNAQGVATLVFDGDDVSGNDVNFDSGSENLDGLTLTVTPGTGNAAPTLDSSTLVVNEDQTVTLTAAMLSASDLNDADSGLVFNVSSVSGGRFEIAGAPGVAVTSFTKAQIDAGDVLFVDDGDELAPAFNVSVSDGLLSDGPVAATINFTPVNDEQTLAVNTGITVAEGSSGNTVTAAMLAVTDADHTADQRVYTLSGIPASGTLYLNGAALFLGDTFTQDDIDNDRVTYDHDGSEITADSFAFSVDDGVGAASAGTFSITVTPQNDAPTASGSCTIAGTDEDTISAAVQVSTIVSDASITVNDRDGDIVGIAVFDTTGLGNWQYSTNGVSGWTDFGTVNPNAALLLSETTWVRYLPDGTNGEIVGFDFRAWDQTTGSSSINGAPEVADTVPGGGTTAYSPSAARVALTVTAANDEQVVATNTGMTVSEGGTGNTITAAMLQATDVDNSADQLVYSVTTVPINGILYLNGMALSASDSFTQDDIDNDRVTYDHDGSETTADSFAFSVDDGVGAASAGTFSITVTPQNDAPTATADSFTVAEGSTTRLNLSGNDSDADDGLDPAAITIVSGPDNGTIDSINADGTVVYTHDGGETRSDSFTYTIDDVAAATSNTVTVSITITPVNDAATGVPAIIGTAQEDGTLSADTSAIGDPDGLGAFSYQWQRSGDGGSTWHNVGPDSATYVLGDSDVGARIRLQVRFTDAQGAGEGPLTSAATAAVANVNDAGAVAIDNTTPVQGTTLTAAVTDPDGTSGPIAYQWQRDGVDIAGATGSSYTTTPDDVGTVITVTASYTDDGAAAEHPTSAGTTPVAGISPPQVPTVDPPADSGEPAGPPPVPDMKAPEPIAEEEAPATEPAAEPSAPPSAATQAAAISSRRPTAGRSPFLVKAAHQVGRILGADTYVKSIARRQAGNPPGLQAEAPTDREPHPVDRHAGLHRRTAARAYLNMVNSLDEVKKEMAGDVAVNQTILGSAIAVSTGLSVGYVVWMIRGGMLLSSLLSSLPAWQILDPLPVLAVRRGDTDADDDESLASMVASQPRSAPGKPAPTGELTEATEET